MSKPTIASDTWSWQKSFCMALAFVTVVSIVGVVLMWGTIMFMGSF